MAPTNPNPNPSPTPTPNSNPNPNPNPHQVIKKLQYKDDKVKTEKWLKAHVKNCSAVRVRVKRDKKGNFVT